MILKNRVHEIFNKAIEAGKQAVKAADIANEVISNLDDQEKDLVFFDAIHAMVEKVGKSHTRKSGQIIFNDSQEMFDFPSCVAVGGGYLSSKNITLFTLDEIEKNIITNRDRVVDSSERKLKATEAMRIAMVRNRVTYLGDIAKFVGEDSCDERDAK